MRIAVLGDGLALHGATGREGAREPRQHHRAPAELVATAIGGFQIERRGFVSHLQGLAGRRRDQQQRRRGNSQRCEFHSVFLLRWAPDSDGVALAGYSFDDTSSFAKGPIPVALHASAHSPSASLRGPRCGS